MILILSNRELNPQGTGVDTFQPCLKVEGSDKVVLAEASLDPNNHWDISLIPSLPVPVQDWEASPQCQTLFKSLINSMTNEINSSNQAGTQIRKNDDGSYYWAILVPGYNSNPQESLQRARELEVLYQVNVILFSWPANPKESNFPDPKLPYKTAELAAYFTSIKLASSLRQLNSLFIAPARNKVRDALGTVRFKVSLLAHSLGNRTLYYLMRSNNHSGATENEDLQAFDAVILHQADVDLDKSQAWIPQIKAARVFITTNFNDGILRISDIINKTRLGTIVKGKDLQDMQNLDTIDFTHAHYVGKAHWLFSESKDQTADPWFQQTIKPFPNERVKFQCAQMLKGEKIKVANGETDFFFNSESYKFEYKSGTL
ncbi:MAG: alpha/beta hydrolase [Cyanobium sp.]